MIVPDLQTRPCRDSRAPVRDDGYDPGAVGKRPSRKSSSRPFILGVGAAVVLCSAGFLLWRQTAGSPPRLRQQEFVYERAPFPSCHASTIVESEGILVSAWFGGTAERNPDVGIWLARRETIGWTPPVEVATGLQEDGSRLPCWNPVLFQPRQGPLLLFYKVGPSPSRWWGMLRRSSDGGRSWSEAQRLPDGILGPVKNKPLQLPDGALLCPSSSEDQGWQVHMERTQDLGRTWSRTAPLNDGLEIAAIQPGLLRHPGRQLQAIGRSANRRLWESWSQDDGLTWSPLRLTSTANPNAGIDALTLTDGRHLLVYNPGEAGRTPLVVSVSGDGEGWRQVLLLADGPGEFSYPAIIQTADGLVHVTYTWNRSRIRHAVIDPGRLR